MCGIAGSIGPYKLSEEIKLKTIFSLKNRGPNASGSFSKKLEKITLIYYIQDFQLLMFILPQISHLIESMSLLFLMVKFIIIKNCQII